jgi:DNA polymerase III subunit delta
VTAGPAPIVLLRGGDAVVLRDAALALVTDLVGSADHSMVVEEVDVGATDGDGADPLVALVDAAQTPPFLTEFRVVVGRVVDKRGKAEDVRPLLDYLADPLPTTRLVLEWRTGTPPKALVEAITACGGRVVDTSPGRKLDAWVAEQVTAHHLRADAGTRARLVTWLGEEPGKLMGLLELLRSTFGDGARLSVEDVTPFLGDDGGVPPWELTDAIDKGEIADAVGLLHRMLGGGGRHPFQVLATLHGHYGRILRLDGAPVTGEKDAAALLGMKGSTFPAKKALASARRLGHDRIVSAVTMLAEADLDLRGGKAWPDALVLEVLVARLAFQARTR